MKRNILKSQYDNTFHVTLFLWYLSLKCTKMMPKKRIRYLPQSDDVDVVEPLFLLSCGLMASVVLLIRKGLGALCLMCYNNENVFENLRRAVTS